MGIGNIPDAVLAKLHNHKDLGIHSEMFASGVVDLVKKGCVTNNKKIIHRGRIVGSFLVGSKQLYDFVDNNPFIEMLEINYVNDTKIICRNPKMTAINSCIEVDLTGQVCSDSIGEYCCCSVLLEHLLGFQLMIETFAKPSNVHDIEFKN